MSTEAILAETAALCRRFEGLYLRPYVCPGGIPTIGYGATFYEDGRKVSLKDPAITRDRAEQLLQWHLRTQFLPPVLAMFPRSTPNQLAALVDFTFNLGVGALRQSTLRRRVIAGDHDAAHAEFLKWVKAGGVILRGLKLRREAEVALYKRAGHVRQ